ncbi:MAG TPA: squalene/phytoene synthase family protein [Stellaceae bacterium]|jgi:phytoene synthase|nr:squalene/phytoene synthase family protein [Stellaceae bacterium]
MIHRVNSRINTGEDRGALSPIAALVRRHDRDRYQTALFAPSVAREALFSLYAFNYEVARVRETVQEPMLGQIRLQWWREAIDTAFVGGAVRAHPVVEAITATIRGFPVDRALFDRVIDARERDLDNAPHANLMALEAYVEGTAAPLVLLALDILSADNAAAQEVARHVGIAYGLAGILRALPFHVRQGRALLADNLSIRDVVETGATHLAAARSRRRDIRAAALPALLGARIAGRTLRQVEKAGFDPFALAGETDPLQSWRLAFGAITGRF